MPTFLESVNTCFGTRDLYKALGVEKTAKESELRQAYHRLSLKVHPDRVSSDEVQDATQKFQVLCKIYSILSDTNKRAIYDEDGTVDEEDDPMFNEDRDWTEYWRLIFPKVTVDDIITFEATYKGSEEEKEDLKWAYIDSEGDMDIILGESKISVMCATIDDEPRFREIIEGWIKEGSVPAYANFIGETESKRNARKRRHSKEAEEAKNMLKTMGADSKSDGSEDSLKALIKARQQSREEKIDGFFESLEQKYCAKKPKIAGSSKSSSKTKTSTNSNKSGHSCKATKSRSGKTSEN